MWLAYEGKREPGGSASEVGGLLFGWIRPRGRSSWCWYGPEGTCTSTNRRLPAWSFRVVCLVGVPDAPKGPEAGTSETEALS